MTQKTPKNLTADTIYCKLKKHNKVPRPFKNQNLNALKKERFMFKLFPNEENNVTTKLKALIVQKAKIFFLREKLNNEIVEI